MEHQEVYPFNASGACLWLSVSERFLVLIYNTEINALAFYKIKAVNPGHCLENIAFFCLVCCYYNRHITVNRFFPVPFLKYARNAYVEV